MRAAASRAGARASAWLRASLAVVAALAAGTATAPAAAQHVLPLADSLAGSRDTAALAALERQLISWARGHRDDPDVHLRLGALALRRGELAGQPHWDHAISEFEWAAELDRDSPLPWYGRGLAWLGMAPERYGTRATVEAILGRDPVARAGSAFREALEKDPAFTPAAVAWGRLALLPALRDELLGALSALRGVPPGAADSTVHLLRGRLERRGGDADSALAAFARYAAGGGSGALARLERARVLLAAGRPGGAAAYFEGAALADSAVAVGYRRDLGYLASDEDLAAFDATSGAGRRAWLERFWRARDLEALRGDGERIAEHYRRLEVALAEFGLPPFKRRFGFQEYYQSGRTDLDDRGVIFVRHGAPTDRNRTVRFQAESWYYAPGSEPELRFHFVAIDDLEDYRLVPSVAQVPEPAREELRELGGPAADQYWRYGTTGSASRVGLEHRMFAAGREMMVRGTTTDTWARRWEHELVAGSQAVAIGVPSEVGRVHVAVAVPLERLPDDGSGGRRLTLRLAAWGPDGAPVRRLDTVVTIRADWGAATGLTRLSFAAPPGPLLVQAELEADSGTGALVLRDTLDVPDADAGLGLSDLVLGRESLRLTWTAGDGEPVALNPLGGFPRNEPLELYYEIYGLGDGLASTELVLWRPDADKASGALPEAGDRRALRLRFEERGTGSVTRARRSVDLDELPPGVYRLRLVVRGGEGREVARTAKLRVARK
jgi:GWxTD domain-containing protein